MSFIVQFHPAVRKDLRRITPSARNKILDEIIPTLSMNPRIGMMLTGPLRGFWKYRVFLFGVWYRIVYTIDTSANEIVIIAIGPRSGFYERLLRRTKK